MAETNQNVKKMIKIGGLSLFFVLIFIYAFFISKDLIFGVKIKNVSIADGTTVRENIVKINGNARNAINLTLDGREISVDQQGNFSETIALSPGYNVVSIRAKDKFGDIDEKNYKLIRVE